MLKPEKPWLSIALLSVALIVVGTMTACEREPAEVTEPEIDEGIDLSRADIDAANRPIAGETTTKPRQPLAQGGPPPGADQLEMRTVSPGTMTAERETEMAVGEDMPAPTDEAARGAKRAQDEGAVHVALTDFEIEMPKTLPAGTTTFHVMNEGEHEHSFEIEGQGIQKELAQTLSAGKSETMTVDLQPGTYRVYCPVGDHAERGMEFEITVEGRGQTQASQ